MPTVEQIWRQALPPGTELVSGEEGLFDEVSWVVSLRPTPPGFNGLKGGELALMRAEVVALLGATLSGLISSLVERGVSAIGLLGALTPEARKEAAAGRLPFFVLPAGTGIAALEGAIIGLINEERGRLYHREREISRSLMRLALAGRGEAAILEELGALTARTVGLLDGDFAPLVDPGDEAGLALRRARPEALARLGRVSGVAGLRLSSQIDCFLGPVTVGQAAMAYLVLTAPKGTLEEGDRLAVRLGLLALEVEMSRRQAVAETEDRFQSELVEQLLTGDLPARQTIVERAGRIGLDLSRDYLVMAARVTGSPHGRDTIARRTNSLLKDSWCCWRGDILVILHPASPERAAPGLRALSKDAAGKLSTNLEGRVSLGLGRCHAGPGGISLSYREAEQTLALGLRLFGPGSATYFGDLGVYRLLFYLKPGGELETFYEEYLGRLSEYDKKHRADLIVTLEARLRHNTIAETAQALNIHRNTLLYRLQRIQDISGWDLEDGETRLVLHLALRAAEVMRSA